jgi:hypothetical protein
MITAGSFIRFVNLESKKLLTLATEVLYEIIQCTPVHSFKVLGVSTEGFLTVIINGVELTFYTFLTPQTIARSALKRINALNQPTTF